MSKKEKSIWDLNPDLKAYYETSDGHKFFSEDAAKTYAHQNKDVTYDGEVKRPNKNKVTPILEEILRAKAIAKLTTVEEVNKALEGEVEQSVIEAGKAQISIIENAGGKKDFELRAEAVAKLDTVEAIDLAIKDETSKTVIKAGNERIAFLQSEARQGK
ncbi:hypothetical protein HSX10_03660 [Winogradskyella undariae]|uniref:hypothetical protein n=1 Tax=Winogradskyella undariae TaxID=1285465 RepID=UPI00156B0F53|nr:hypothetical protein [Winogradskyella undariae]NRR90656.1 hypothetical protein [Winogradskyella undariae]